MGKLTPRQMVLAYLALVFALPGIRGLALAQMLNGAYLVSSWLVDSLGLLVILLAFRGVDHLVHNRLKIWIPGHGRMSLVSIFLIRTGVVFLFFLPPLMVILQLHPVKVASREGPGSMGLDFEEVRLELNGTKIEGWYVPGKKVGAPVVLVAHGIGANKQNFLYPVKMVNDLGYGVLIIDFRAHGDSRGMFSTLGFREAEDVKASFDWLLAREPGRPVYALGFSMGAAAVVHAQAKYGIFEKVVLDSCFESLQEMAGKQFLVIYGPLAPLGWKQLRFWAWGLTGVDPANNSPGQAIRGFGETPVLLIHGGADPLIPYDHSIRLSERLGGQADLWLVEEAGHVGSMVDPDYPGKLARFFGR